MKKLNAQERVFEIVNALYRNHVHGLTNKELAAKLETTEATVCRDMALMEECRWAARDGKSAWRLSPEFGRISGEILKSYQTAKLEITKAEAEYLAAIN